MEEEEIMIGRREKWESYEDRKKTTEKIHGDIHIYIYFFFCG